MKPRWILLASAGVLGVFLASWWGQREAEAPPSAPAPRLHPARPSPPPAQAPSGEAPAPSPSLTPAPAADPPPKPVSPWGTALARLKEAARAYETRRKDGEAAALAERELFLQALRELMGLPLESAEGFEEVLALENRLLDGPSLRTLADELWNHPAEPARLNAIALWSALHGSLADPVLETRLKGEALACLGRLAGGDAVAARLAVGLLNRYLHLFPQDAEAVVAVSRALSRADAESRGTAAITLGNVRSDAALSELKRLAREDPDSGVQSFALWSLGGFRRDQLEDILPVIRTRMEQGDINALLTLARLGEKDAGPRIIQLLPYYANDPYEGTLLSGALHPLLDEGTRAALSPLLKHADAKVRANAAAALALAKDPAGREILWETLEKGTAKPGGRLEEICAMGLGRLGDGRARPLLERMALSGDARLRELARDALEELAAKP